MKPRQALHALLLLPILVCSAPLALLWLVQDPTGNSAIENAFRGVAFFVALHAMISIQLWGVPYVVLAGGLYLWSRHKSGPRILEIYRFAPFMLALLAVLQVLVVAVLESRLGTDISAVSTSIQFVGTDSLFTAVLSVIFGYLLILLGLGGFRLLWYLGFFTAETPLRLDEIEEW